MNTFRIAIFMIFRESYFILHVENLLKFAYSNMYKYPIHAIGNKLIL